MKPADIKAEIARARDEMERLRRYIDHLEQALTLTPGHRSVSAVNVNSSELDDYTKRAATRSTREHEALRILYEHNITQSALARKLKESRSRVSAWFAEGTGNRPIPRPQAERLLREYGVPLAAWDRIAD